MSNKLQKQEKLILSRKFTPHSLLLFIVWKKNSLPGKSMNCKARVVVEIQRRIKIAESDCYFIPSQTDITSAVANAKFITIVDAISFIYQFLIPEKNYDNFTVVSYWRQKKFKFILMVFKNSLA